MGGRMRQKKESKIVYWLDNQLYLNITNSCSNNCEFCIRKYKRGVGGFHLKLNDEPSPAKIIEELREVAQLKEWTEMVFCGFGEPTERLDCLLEVTRWMRKHHRKPLIVRVNTNGHGYVLNPTRKVVNEMKAVGVDRLSISLNASDEKTYKAICKPKFDGAYSAVLDFIKEAKKLLDVEITAVAIEEVDLQRIAAIADSLGVKFRVRQHIPCFW
jgi:TatD family-associated radical SAM protein